MTTIIFDNIIENSNNHELTHNVLNEIIKSEHLFKKDI